MKSYIQKYRKIAGLTQAALAEKLNISTRTVQKYESGEITPPLNKFKEIAEILDISVNELIGLDNEIEFPLSEGSTIKPVHRGIRTVNSLTQHDYNIGFIRSHFISVKQTNDLDKKTQQLIDIVKINDISYTKDEFNNLMNDAIDYILFKVEKKKHHDKYNSKG